MISKKITTKDLYTSERDELADINPHYGTTFLGSLAIVTVLFLGGLSAHEFLKDSDKINTIASESETATMINSQGWDRSHSDQTSDIEADLSKVDLNLTQ